jgi:hypothetical protein
MRMATERGVNLDRTLHYVAVLVRHFQFSQNVAEKLLCHSWHSQHFGTESTNHPLLSVLVFRAAFLAEVQEGREKKIGIAAKVARRWGEGRRGKIVRRDILNPESPLWEASGGCAPSLSQKKARTAITSTGSKPSEAGTAPHLSPAQGSPASAGTCRDLNVPHNLSINYLLSHSGKV